MDGYDWSEEYCYAAETQALLHKVTDGFRDHFCDHFCDQFHVLGMNVIE